MIRDPPLIEVKAMEGVKSSPRTTVKCQKDTSVTKMGEAFLRGSM